MKRITLFLSDNGMFVFDTEYECERYEKQVCRQQLFCTQAKDRLEVTCDVIDIDYDNRCIFLLLKERFFISGDHGYTDSWVLYRMLYDEDGGDNKWEVGVKKAVTERVFLTTEDIIEDGSGYYPGWKEDFLPMEYLNTLSFGDTESLLKAIRTTFLWLYEDGVC